VHFIKLVLTENGKIVSDNFYWRGSDDGNLQSLRELPKITLKEKTKRQKTKEGWKLTTILENESDTPCLMVRLKVVGNKTGERILPVFYSDNYVFLMPGESKEIMMKFQKQDTRGEKPIVKISGFNYEP